IERGLDVSDAEHAALIERARTGDGRAFEQLALHEERALYRHAARILGAGPDAEDVVQDAFLSAWRSIGSFEGSSFRAWLFRIVTNRALDRVRSRRRGFRVRADRDDHERRSGHGEVAHPSRARRRAERAHLSRLERLGGMMEPITTRIVITGTT